jgi:hypothetical protein
LMFCFVLYRCFALFLYRCFVLFCIDVLAK